DRAEKAGIRLRQQAYFVLVPGVLVSDRIRAWVARRADRSVGAEPADVEIRSARIRLVAPEHGADAGRVGYLRACRTRPGNATHHTHGNRRSPFQANRGCASLHMYAVRDQFVSRTL